jgi:hypothetical protein
MVVLLKFNKIYRLAKTFDDNSINTYLSATHKDYITKKDNRDRLVTALVLYFVNKPNKKYLVFKLYLTILKANQNPLEYSEQNPNLRNQAVYYFATRDRASQYLLFLKQEFANRYQLYDFNQLQDRNPKL